MIGAVTQVEAGRKAEEVAREMGVSKHTIYAGKQKFGGLDVAGAQELQALRYENARLKRLVADLSLDKDVPQFVIRNRSLRAARFWRGRWSARSKMVHIRPGKPSKASMAGCASSV